jgi:ADP-ribosyl-[dinitrogen reductase] hydrolase
MDDFRKRIIGSWFGMAVGDAMGRPAKGLKPAAIRQIFGAMDGFKDVRSIIGKGIKGYRMQGLYGAPTQCALAVGDALLKNKKKFLEESIKNFQRLAKSGPEGYFGTYRNHSTCLWRAVDLLDYWEKEKGSKQNSSTSLFVNLAVPLALFQSKWSKTLVRQCFDACLLMSRNRFEVVGAVLNGFLVTRFLALHPEENALAPVDILQEAIEICCQAEEEYHQRFPSSEDGGLKGGDAMSGALKGLAEKFYEPNVLQWLCEYSNSFNKLEIHYPSQGFVMSLLPLALYCLLNPPEPNFASTLTHSLSHGRETEMLGALVGAWAGALYGIDNIPTSLKSGLVNAKEIRLRAEALSVRRGKKDQKDLFNMEAGLTAKEFEEGKRNLPKGGKKAIQLKSSDLWDEEEDETSLPSKEDRAQWRQFQKEKTKSKRDRRKNIPSMDNL